MLVSKFIIPSACGLLAAQTAFAGAHTWDVVEVFSNADGTIQFVEIREMAGTPGEVNLNGLSVTSDANGVIWTFTANLVGPSTNKSILLGTAAFAALPGAPTPDHIIDPNSFNIAGDTVRYGPYDAFTFPAVPTNCVNSMNDGGIVAPNTPKNYAGQTGSVDCSAPVCPADIFGADGQVNIDDLLLVINNWGAVGSNPADATGNNVVDIDDLLVVINGWGPCK